MGYDNLIGIQTSAYVVRFIVPFQFGEMTDSNAYNHAYARLTKHDNWQMDMLDEDEPDCYEYLYELYRNRVQTGGSSNIGSMWKYKAEKTAFPVLEYNEPVFEEKPEEEEKKPIIGADIQLYAKIADCGLYLLKTGIGLFWYEMKYANSLEELMSEVAENPEVSEPMSDIEISVETIIRFQNMFKELARPHYKIHRVEVSDDLEIAQREVCLFGLWINEMLDTLGTKIKYYPQRTRSKEIICPEYYEKEMHVSKPDISNGVIIPDKAILFNYIAIDKEKNKIRLAELETMAYYLTMGYNKGYTFGNIIRKSMFHHRENIIWFTQKEGCGEYVMYDKKDCNFFTTYKFARVRMAYFHIYMHLLQQSYNLLHMAEEISELVIEENAHLKKENRRIEKHLEEMQTKINIFLIKNVNASISHVSNHNKYYAYVENALKVKEDIVALQSGLDSLDEILRRREKEIESKKTERMQNAFAVLSLVSIVTLLKDLFDTYGWFQNPENQLTRIHWVIIVVVLLLALFVLWNSWGVIKTLFKFDKDD